MAFSRSWGMALLGAALLGGFGAAAGAVSPPQGRVVRVGSGRIAGESAGAVSIFRGIPYAAPPVGRLRWLAPRHTEPWKGVRATTHFGPACPQSSAEKIDILKFGGAPEPASEDCLTLNVWAPTHAWHAAVMVWIHGGAGRIGAGSLPYYDGAFFARDGVVLVTINYRLGHLGAFAYPGLSEEAAQSSEPAGAYATMDQLAALQWVKRNIAAFGGDPGNVTLFGESSGAISVLTLLSTPSARGLFEKAIVESGGGWFPPPPSRDDAERAGKAVAAAADAPANATLAQLRAMPAAAIMRAGGDSVAAPDVKLGSEGMTTAIAAGRVAQVPLMIGVTDGEDSLIDRGIAQAKAKVDADTLANLSKLYGEKLDLETAARYEFRDALGTAPARWVAAHWPAPAYLYRFEHVSQSYRPARKRAHHGAEIFYVFQTLGREPDEASHPTRADEALAAEMHARWVAFAKTGSPNRKELLAWPAYAKQSDAWMVFGQNRTAVQHHLMQKQLDYYQGRFAPLILYFRLREAVLRFLRWL